MTKLERNILKAIVDNLQDSTQTSWITGDFNQWIKYARQMKTTINNEINILNTLLSEETNPIVEPELPEEGGE